MTCPSSAGGELPCQASADVVAANRLSTRVTSVIDLHVSIALQDVDTEKWRLISRTTRAILGR